MEIASLAFRGENDPLRGLVSNIAADRIYDCERSSGLFHYGTVVVLDALLLENSVSDRLQQALLKTRIAFFLYLQKAEEAQVAYLSETPYNKAFLFEFSATLKAVRQIFKSVHSEVFKSLFLTIFMSPEDTFETLEKRFTPFLVNERIIRFETLTERKIPFNLLSRLEALSDEEKQKVKDWFVGCLIPVERDLLTDEEAKKEALQRVSEVPKVLYTLFKYFKPRESYFSWIAKLHAIVGDYRWDRTRFQLPSGPLPEGFEALKSVSLFSVCLYLNERDKASPFFPLSHIRYVDPCGRGLWREKLNRIDVQWVPLLIRRIFEKGVMPVNSTTKRFTFSDFGIASDGFLKAHSRQCPVRINYYHIDDFIWQAAGSDFNRYVKLYHESHIVRTPYGEVLKLIGYSIMDWEAETIVDRAKAVKLDDQFIVGQLQGYERLDRKLYITEETKDENFLNFWKSRSWEFFPGLWFRHVPMKSPVEKYKELIEKRLKGCPRK